MKHHNRQTCRPGPLIVWGLEYPLTICYPRSNHDYYTIRQRSSFRPVMNAYFRHDNC